MHPTHARLDHFHFSRPGYAGQMISPWAWVGPSTYGAPFDIIVVKMKVVMIIVGILSHRNNLPPLWFSLRLPIWICHLPYATLANKLDSKIWIEFQGGSDSFRLLSFSPPFTSFDGVLNILFNFTRCPFCLILSCVQTVSDGIYRNPKNIGEKAYLGSSIDYFVKAQ